MQERRSLELPCFFNFAIHGEVLKELTGITLAACLLWGCSRPETPPPAVVKPDFVGVVDRVYPAQKYALVRVGGVMPPEGTTLISHAPDGGAKRVANLMVSPERIGNLRIPADIRSGSIEPGDLVFVYKGLAAPSPKEAEEDVPETEEQKVKENGAFPSGAPVRDDGLLTAPGDGEMPVHSPAPPPVGS